MGAAGSPDRGRAVSNGTGGQTMLADELVQMVGWIGRSRRDGERVGAQAAEALGLSRFLAWGDQRCVVRAGYCGPAERFFAVPPPAPMTNTRFDHGTGAPTPAIGGESWRLEPQRTSRAKFEPSG